MAASAKYSASSMEDSLSELSLDLARIDTSRPCEVAEKILTVFAYHLRTDRASLLLIDPEQAVVQAGFAIGFNVCFKEWNPGSGIVKLLCQRETPLLLYNIRDYPELVSEWSQTYRTDVVAIFPLLHERRVIGAICLSNLSAQHLNYLEQNPLQLNLALEQARQLCLLLPAGCGAGPAEAQVSPDELTLIATLLEKLDRSMDTRNVFAVFAELVSQYLPVDTLVIIHDKLRERQQGVICVQRPVHATELRTVFSAMSSQWQRRHKRAPILDYGDAALIGTELVDEGEECVNELALGRFESFPVYIDNDLFALVGLATSEEAYTDRRRMRLFEVLAHQLFMHVKKGLLIAQSQEMQAVDALTGLYSERHFYQMMEREFDRASRYNVPLCLLIMDVDHFKDVNEAYGFETGDLLLQEISRIIMENVRSTDLASRYSGERFIIVLPETHYKNSEIMATRIRRYIENNSFFIPNTNVYIKVTVSLGVASYLEHKPASLAQFIEFADTALYFAKRNGRNQVIGYSYVINMMMHDSGHES